MVVDLQHPEVVVLPRVRRDHRVVKIQKNQRKKTKKKKDLTKDPSDADAASEEIVLI